MFFSTELFDLTPNSHRFGVCLKEINAFELLAGQRSLSPYDRRFVNGQSANFPI